MRIEQRFSKHKFKEGSSRQRKQLVLGSEACKSWRVWRYVGSEPWALGESRVGLRNGDWLDRDLLYLTSPARGLLLPEKDSVKLCKQIPPAFMFPAVLKSLFRLSPRLASLNFHRKLARATSV